MISRISLMITNVMNVSFNVRICFSYLYMIVHIETVLKAICWDACGAPDRLFPALFVYTLVSMLNAMGMKLHHVCIDLGRTLEHVLNLMTLVQFHA